MKKCDVWGCKKSVERRIWCNAHYRKFLKYGDPTLKADPDETKRKMSLAKKKNPTRYWLGREKSPEHILMNSI